MPITPDTKDWTWVLERRCPECGFESANVPKEQVAGMIRDNAATWRAILCDSPRLKERPSDDRWSALEYGCHVRDVYRLYDQRLALMLNEDDPTFPNWDQDVTAVEERYNEQDPARVAKELGAAADQMAASFDVVSDEHWQRTGTRSDGAHFTVDTFARYLIHDPVHHLHDVADGLGALEIPPMTTADDNLATIRRIYDAFGNRDVEVFRELFAEDISIFQTPELPWGGHFEGHDGAFTFMLGLAESFDSTVTTESMFAAGDHVVQTGRTRGTLKANAASFDVPELHLWELRDGKVVRFSVYLDTPAMLDALAR